MAQQIGALVHPYIFSYLKGTMVHRLITAERIPVPGQDSVMQTLYHTACRRTLPGLWWERTNVKDHTDRALCLTCFPR